MNDDTSQHERYVIETTCPNCGHVSKSETSVEALSKARDWARNRSFEGLLPATEGAEMFERGRATGTVEGWADYTNAPHLVPENEALSDGERDCAVVLKWWQDLVVAQGKRAERAEAAFAALVDGVVDREVTDYIAERQAREKTGREAARSMLADMRGEYEG